MSRNWEQTFASWTRPASDSEQTKYENTSRSIKAALASHQPLSEYSFEVYAKGSYPNYTNVRQDSDVDVAAELTDFIQNEFIYEASELSLQDVSPGATTYTKGYTLAQFKDDVEAALVATFGRTAVTRGKKALHIRESTQGLKADVVPCNSIRTWTSRTQYADGIQLRNDARPSEHIINYPKQHLAEGKEKNRLCSKRYKSVVRILKRLENEMVDGDMISPVPSFLIESAVWNAPNGCFLNPHDWTGRVRAVLRHIFNGTLTDECIRSNDWLEANGEKYLFFDGQNWDYTDLHEFASEAWDYIGFS